MNKGQDSSLIDQIEKFDLLQVLRNVFFYQIENFLATRHSILFKNKRSNLKSRSSTENLALQKKIKTFFSKNCFSRDAIFFQEGPEIQLWHKAFSHTNKRDVRKTNYIDWRCERGVSEACVFCKITKATFQIKVEVTSNKPVKKSVFWISEVFEALLCIFCYLLVFVNKFSKMEAVKLWEQSTNWYNMFTTSFLNWEMGN